MENSGLIDMLEYQKTDDLNMMYKLLSRVAGLQIMASRVSAHFREEGKGKTLVNAIKSGTISGVNFIDVDIVHIVIFHFILNNEPSVFRSELVAS